MKTLLPILLCLLINSSLIYGQSPNWQWVKSFGGGKNDGGLDVAADAAGNVYTIGYFRDTIDFDPGPGTFNLIADTSTDGSVFLSKLDAAGNFIWAKMWDKDLYNGTFSIDPDVQGNILITGHYTGTLDFDPGPGTHFLSANGFTEYFILKLSSQGNFIWVKTFGGVFNTPICHTSIDTAGNIINAGFFSQVRDFDPGTGVHLLTAVSRDIYVLKLNASGNFLWVKQISGTYNNWVRGLALDTLNNIYITGTFSGTTDFDPGPGSDSLVAGVNIYEDIFIAKLDASGNYGWAKRIGNTSNDWAFGIAVDHAGYVYTTGQYNPAGTGVDFDPGPGTYILNEGIVCFISKLDSSGNFVFAKSIGCAGTFCVGRALTLDAGANIYFTGYYTDSADFDPGPGAYILYADSLYGTPLYISKMDSSGNFIWAESKGGKYHPGIQQNSGLALFCDAPGNIYLTGKYEDPDISFGTSILFNYTPDTLVFTDAFIAKINSSGTGWIDIAGNNNGTYVYPNPSAGVFNFHSEEKNTELEIFNALGEKIFNLRLFTKMNIPVDLRNQPAGIYFYVLRNKDEVVKSGKLLKE